MPLARRSRSSRSTFTRPDQLVEALTGVRRSTTRYWLRFPRGAMSYDRAVEQSVVLLDAARQAGVARLVHVSVVNASIGGPTHA